VKRSLLFSLVLHATFILFALKGSIKGSNSAETKKSKSIGGTEEFREIIEQKEVPKPLEILQETKEQFDIRIEKQERKRIKDCPHYFGGIGVLMSRDGTIHQVFKFYPASDAGLKSGDIVQPGEPIEGEIGKELVLDILRDGKVLSVKMIRGKICTEGL
jgi:hypothetical protein